MKEKNGFALLLSLMLLLVLTLFALILLLISGSYYASARNLFENENARLACDQVSKLMVDTHNLENEDPRFFLDPDRWQGMSMIPFEWNGYKVQSQLKSPWNTLAANEIRVEVSKGRHISSQDLDITQIRLEDFSLYLNTWQSFFTASLVDGRVSAPNGIDVQMPVVRFRDFVQGTITPELNASFRKRTEQVIAYPLLTEILNSSRFFEAAQANGLLITGRNPLFWNGTEYEANLDLFSLQEQTGNRWRVLYNGTDLGVVAGLHFWFDDVVSIHQSYRQIPHFPEVKLIAPIYFSSASNVLLESSLQSLEGPNHQHPICITSAGSISITESAPSLVRIDALLMAYGNSIHDGIESGLILEPGLNTVSTSELESWKAEIVTSTLIVESEKRESLLSTVNSGGKVVWLRGSVALTASIYISSDIEQLHFQSSIHQYPFLPSLPFVRIVEGSQRWH